MNQNLTGALLMTASMASFTINDTFVKLTGGEVPLFQLLFLRGILSSLLVLGLAQALGALRFDISRRDWGLILMRCATEIAAAYFFLSALFHMPLANVTAILQMLPLTVTLGAAVLYREAVGWRRMLAIGIGFCGMMLIVRPGADGFSIWSLYAVAAVGCVTCRDLVTRKLGKAVPSMTVTFAMAFSVTLFAGGMTLVQPWAPVSGFNAIMIAASAVCILGGYFFSIQVMRGGDVSFIAPFRYTSLVFALIIGWLVFGDWPTLLTLLGAAIVVGMGLFTLYRESAVKR